MEPAVPAERTDKMTLKERIYKKVTKRENLENGRNQFRHIPALEKKAYVWVGNVSMPVSIR